MTPFGLYECNRMPFGLSNALVTSSWIMQRSLNELIFQILLVYLDDVIAFQEHLERLYNVFGRLKEHRLELKPSKLSFLREGATYGGH